MLRCYAISCAGTRLFDGGQAFLSQVVNAVRNGPYWKDSIIFITYDEHGGFYDHARRHRPWTMRRFVEPSRKPPAGWWGAMQHQSGESRRQQRSDCRTAMPSADCESDGSISSAMCELRSVGLPSSVHGDIGICQAPLRVARRQ